ncbi:SMP-30/gluconolactonase/LRE family protein [Cupriavidus numazuensis]|uniref:Gluconolactonase n=1 Tax=Cupriavidus numazuensis TaxID=221992 RepID=A0ABN7PX03_9BURK|nr:SMP-30/gluconolactonase/LRE family protein [Cupriavidus numazuensis]CAG2144981.1 Gluconolactonase [Cupriavidus numazuensis]
MEMREIASGLQFPEGPLALENGDLLICEVAGGTIRRIGRDGRMSLLARTGGAPSGLAFGPDGYCYVCNGGIGDFHERNGRLAPHFAPDVAPSGSIQRLDVETGKFETLYTHCDGKPLIAPNDLVIDAHGGIWFTDHGKVRRDDRDHGALYYAKTDGSGIKRMVTPLLGPNGVGLSPDGNHVYVAETPTARAWRFDLAAPDEIARSPDAVLGSRGHLLCGLGGWQWLDSLKVDAEGWICVATLFNGGITAISPDGKQVEHVAMPDPFTTNLAFGGPDMRTAYVVLSSLGKVVAVPWARRGLRLNHAR